MNRVDTSTTPYDTVVLRDFEDIKRVVKPTESITFDKPFIIILLADSNNYFLNNKKLRTGIYRD